MGYTCGHTRVSAERPRQSHTRTRTRKRTRTQRTQEVARHLAVLLHSELGKVHEHLYGTPHVSSGSIRARA
eukprot:190971-Rhodomonas_salina.2